MSEKVSPYIGEWIEIIDDLIIEMSEKVSPYIGEWIEIDYVEEVNNDLESHLT